MDIFNPVVTIMALVKLNGSQDKTPSHQSGKGTGRLDRAERVDRDGKEVREIRGRVIRTHQNVLHTCMILSTKLVNGKWNFFSVKKYKIF